MSFLPNEKKIEKFGIFRENFPNPEVADPKRPDLNSKKMT